ncbi:hypothetical protein [Spirosoma montaniterrae]|uniref:Outer membrane protein beta-barrel domain-containing protein n=1 Tax=Spirosoma montaniterrae TaxID=1178516 RepID=A0A1P9WT67_9BACT|nr:hypothetical protein [Spirosoma montaniterrae]AQG78552.1 hypothetical protein AWR27_03865 [Spirosoma montaniterrae]
MKAIKLTLLFYFSVSTGMAQKTKPAILIKVDSTVLKAYGLRFQGNQVYYRLSPSAKMQMMRLHRVEISRIKYADGREEMITIKLLPLPVLRSAYTQLIKEPPGSTQKANKGHQPDRIYKKDKSIIECKIIDITPTEIKYVVITDHSQRVRSIRQKEIERIEQNTVKDSARVVGEMPQRTPAKEPEKNRSPVRVEAHRLAQKQDAPQKQTEEVTMQRKIPKSDYAYSTYILGIEASQMLAIGGSQWADERKGLGLKMAIGGLVQYTKRLNRTIGFVAEVGFTEWASEYRFSRETDLLYVYSVGLSRASVRIGSKLYVGKAFYVLPKAHIEGLRLRQGGYDGKSVAAPDRIQSTIYWGGSGAFGYEHRVGSKVMVDASIGYNYIAKPLPLLDYAYPPNEVLHLISLRVGFGLISYRTPNR